MLRWDCPRKESRWECACKESLRWDCPCKESFFRLKGLSMQGVVEVGLFLQGVVLEVGLSMQGVVLEVEGNVNARSR
jgi:hypothetical protein